MFDCLSSKPGRPEDRRERSRSPQSCRLHECSWSFIKQVSAALSLKPRTQLIGHTGRLPSSSASTVSCAHPGEPGWALGRSPNAGTPVCVV